MKSSINLALSGYTYAQPRTALHTTAERMKLSLSPAGPGEQPVTFIWADEHGAVRVERWLGEELVESASVGGNTAGEHQWERGAGLAVPGENQS